MATESKADRTNGAGESAVPADAPRLWTGHVRFRIRSAEATFGRPSKAKDDDSLLAATRPDRTNGNGNGSLSKQSKSDS
jgi:hypothetical protein